MSESGVVWGKWDSAETPYPLLAHLIDTAAFALAFWEDWLSAPAKAALTAAGIETGKHLAWIAGIHDCGKADPWFIGQIGSHKAAFFSANLELLAQSGLPRLPYESRFAGKVAGRGPMARRLLRHEAMSGHALSREGLPTWVSAVVSGHHGRYQPDVEFPTQVFVGKHRAWVDASAWSAEQNALQDQLLNSLGLAHKLGFPCSVDGAVIPFVTGLVCLADWSASDEGFIASADLGLMAADLGAYLAARTTQARSALPGTVGVPVRPVGSFPDLFSGFVPDRAVQRWAVASVACHGPALSIVAVPMGEGKTETALWMHATTDAADGLVFALPTMATADAMFERIRSFYAGTPALATLKHGSALLNAFYDDSSAHPVGVCDSDDPGGLSGSEWLRGRHRALTAPVTVSTCDQVLAAAVDHKFLPVRLASLANKHVVLDEVHTYDPYQDALLKRLLGWLGRYRTRVTLLTATLPTRRLNDYLKAYGEGSGHTPTQVGAAYPAVTQILPGSEPVTTALAAHRTYQHQLRCERLMLTTGSFADFQAEFAAITFRYVSDVLESNPNARVAVIVNTVDRAVRLAQFLQGQEPLVLHSRMTSGQRARATERLLAEAGPKAGPGRLLLVSTQVAEASLDIDVDVLITDLAPMASLLQRMGRQWRHSTPTPQGWSHATDSNRDQVGPTVHVLIGLEESGSLHEHATLPYTRAEVSKTLAFGLQDGRRTGIAIPGELQGLVDACDVSLADLTGTADAQSLLDLTAHLGQAADATDQALRVGTDVARLSDGWNQTPKWDTNPQLARLTQPSLWQVEAVTRLRDSDSISLLVLDASSLTRWAYPGTADDLMSRNLTRRQIVTVLSCVVQVNGSLARALTNLPLPSGWLEQPTSLLRSTRPADVTRLAALNLRLDPVLGLVKE